MEQASPSPSGHPSPSPSGHPYLPGTASLVQEIDSECVGLWGCILCVSRALRCAERVLVVLRDYKVLIGYLRSVDQFGRLEGINEGTVVVGFMVPP